jgi:hypothetical protein
MQENEILQRWSVCDKMQALSWVRSSLSGSSTLLPAKELLERQLDIIAVLLQHRQIGLPVGEAHRLQVANSLPHLNAQGYMIGLPSPLLGWSEVCPTSLNSPLPPRLHMFLSTSPFPLHATTNQACQRAFVSRRTA